MDTKQISEHMQQYAMSMIARAVVDATFSEMTKPFSHDMSVYLVASSLEILLKAKLFEIEPSCIFEQGEFLTEVEFQDYSFLNLKTKPYNELPELIKQKFSIVLNLNLYKELGIKRNQVVHLGNINIQEIDSYVIKTVFEFILPLMIDIQIDLNDFFDFLYEWDEVSITDGYILDQINTLNLKVPDIIRLELENHVYKRITTQS